MAEHRTAKQLPIAIVGVSALFPGSRDAGGFWRDILAGRDLLTDVPETHWLVDDYYDPDPAAPDKTYGKRGGFLPPVDFDPLAFGVPPSIVPATDTAQLLAMIVAQQVLDDAAQGQFASMNRDRISVVLGVCGSQELMTSLVGRIQRPVWVKALRQSGIPESEVEAICDRIASNYVPWQEASFPGLLGNVVAGRIANKFDLHGTNCVTDAACASSLSALHLSMNELALGQSDMVITGGVDTMNDPFTFMCFSKTPALSPSGDCRPFSDASDGTMLGEGLGMFALKRLDDAERDGDRIYAVLRGLGASSDGQGTAIYAPVSKGQARALFRAYDNAGYGPETVELLEAHGTGTKAGDVAEFEGVRAVFDASGRQDRQWCALGSIKSQIGHTKAAAGAAGLFKIVMALHHKVLPPTLKVERPNPRLEIETSAFYLNTQARPWIRDAAHPRRASVSSFGFGGSNFHVTLEEYIPAQAANARCAWQVRTAPTELVLLGAATAPELSARCRALANAKSALVALARESQMEFQVGAAVRLAVVAADSDELARKLEQAAALIDKTPTVAFSAPGIHYGCGAAQPGPIAFLFSGQGSQYVGMGAELAMHCAPARAAWDAAAHLRFDNEALHRVVFPIPAFSDAERTAQGARLMATEWAQPALAAQSLALLNVMRALGIQADCFGGHSFGELVALHAADAYDAATLLRLARRRGELMRDTASIPGAMLAIGLAYADVEAALARLAITDVGIANHNGPAQVVVSGPSGAIARLEQALAVEGVAAKRLNVATAFHSPLVAPAAGPLREFLDAAAIRAPQGNVFGNTDAALYPADADQVRARLAAQLAQPVRFVDEIEAMYARGVRTFIEIGAGATLADLTGQILEGREHLAVSCDRKGKSGITSLHEALARLAVRGVAMDFAPLWAAYAPPVQQAPKKKPAMTLKITGSNYGRPYPPPGGASELPPPNPARAAATTAVAAVAVAPSYVHSTNAALELAPASVATADVAVAEAPAPAAAYPTYGEPSMPMNDDSYLAWVQAFQESQRQTAEAHAAYQRAMADSHMAFLKLAETSTTSLAAMLAGSAPAPQPAPAMHVAPALSLYVPPPPVPAHVPEPVAAAVSERSVAPTRPLPVPVSAPARTDSMSADLHALLLAVVAEKTGYPAEMLGAHMELEGDLGIDSIKRVEILSAMRERAPMLAEVKPAELGKLRTLGQIVEHLQANGSATSSATAPAPAIVAPVAALLDLETMLLSVVAEKTGYPAEMLAPHMELEGDLGIDSIKRVEILSAMRERAPQLQELKPAELGKLRTLGQIVEQLGGAGSAAPAPVASVTTTPAVDLEALLLSVVAEKTGYPAEMLAPHMELEGDLGIDSIKRVEILSAMRERAPGLAELKPAELGKLRSLGQIVEQLRGGVPAPVVPAVTEPPAATEKKTDLRRLTVHAVTNPAPGLGMAQLRRRPIFITDDTAGIAPLLAARLGERGVHATVVAEAPPDAHGVIFLGGLRRVASVDDAIAINREAFHNARKVAATLEQRGGLFVTVQDTGGDFGLGTCEPTRAWLGGLAGLARTAAREWSLAAVKAIDCECGARPAAAIAAAIAHELFHGGAALDVGLRADGSRVTLESVPAEVAVSDTARITSSSVIVATGGARGVTAAALIALARAFHPRIVLIGRTLPIEHPEALRVGADEAETKRILVEEAQKAGRAINLAEIGAAAARITAAREVQATVEALMRAGSSVRYFATDILDAASIQRVLAEVRREWGPITGIVHGAGVLADKKIADKTDDQFNRVFDTKVKGLRALLEATKDDPLAVICLFSSIAAHTGNAGQSDYAMANAVLSHVAGAERARRPQCLVRSIEWGAWQGGMVTAALAEHFHRQGVALIPLAAGAQAFVAEVSARPDDVRVVIAAGAGGGPLGAASAHASATEIHIDDRSHAYLADHAIAGLPVVPVALVLEWFARAARAWQVAPTVLRDVRVLRKIGLDHFTNGGQYLRIEGQENAEGDHRSYSLELRGGDALYYRGQVDATGAAPPAPWKMPVDLEPWDRDAIYDGRTLFHGPRFHVIRTLDGISPAGATARLATTRELGWNDERWQTDAATIDGALQLALLWGEQVLGGASLPMAVSEMRTLKPGLADGPVHCIVRRREVKDTHALCDIALFDTDDSMRAEMLGVEIVLRPDAPAVH
jgi:acyl transferase domain-containing protein/NADP-dependent 3-hydroxy acid dehydrogenase YdfG